MALIGTYRRKVMEPVPGEFEMVTITYPEAEFMAEDDPNLSKAGQTIEEEQQVMEEKEYVVENAYVVITNYSLLKDEYLASEWNNGVEIELGLNKTWAMNVHARIYESKEAREADPDSHVYYEDRRIELGTVNDTIFNIAYQGLKNQNGFQELQHDI